MRPPIRWVKLIYYTDSTSPLITLLYARICFGRPARIAMVPPNFKNFRREMRSPPFFFPIFLILIIGQTPDILMAFDAGGSMSTRLNCMKRGGCVSRRVNQKTRNGDQVKRTMENLYHQIKKNSHRDFFQTILEMIDQKVTLGEISTALREAYYFRVQYVLTSFSP